MTCVLTGFARNRTRIGTIYSNGTLTAADTDINVYGPDITITPPTVPADDQTINITNTGSDPVVIAGVKTITAGESIVIYWGGASWGWAANDCSGGSIPATSDRGTSVYAGPSETTYTVPQTTIDITGLIELPCGTSVIKKVTKTYALRSEVQFYAPASTAINGPTIPGGTIINVGDGSNYTPNPITTAPSYPITVGTSHLNAAQNLATYLLANSISQFSQISPPSSPFAVKLYADASGATTYRARVFYQPYSGGVPFGSPGRVYISDPPTTQGTLYYLDLHEVWTYEAI